MSGRLEKKIRRTVAREIKNDLETLAKAICEEKFIVRLAYAIKILFKREKMKFVLVNNITTKGENENDNDNGKKDS